MFKKCDKYSSLVFLIHNVFLSRSKFCRTEQLTVLATAQTTRDALVKVSINKANPATDEARVENQSMVLRGLA